MYRNLKICIIGNGTHSKRIQDILKKKNIDFLIFKPKSKKNYKKENIEFLKKFDAIFIVSPDKTHFHYINKLYRFCYMFCEKPPCNNSADLNRLMKIKSKNIYYNFNHRFSKIADILKNKNKFNLGKLLYGNIISCHGLGLKKEYENSWRSNKKLSLNGIFEVVSIHWIDLINYIFTVQKIENKRLFNVSKYGSSFDNSNIKLLINKNSFVDIYNSWTTALVEKKIFIFANGIIEEGFGFITIKGPSKNLDKNNFFLPPKIIKKIKVDKDNDELISLRKSIEHFIEIVLKKGSFDIKNNQISLKSNHLLFDNNLR
tara:strand:- start:42 stop:986 length:945 start_codon:yes stop_codon:yes gene_type:complete